MKKSHLIVINFLFFLCVSNACSAGEFLDAGSSSCIQCPVGQYSGAGATSCTLCASHTYSGTTGAATCTACPSGSTSNAGSSVCSCFGGLFFDTSSSLCAQCPAGTYSGAGAASCTSCIPNTYSGAGSPTCTACPAGSASIAGSSSCICPAGYFYSSGSCTQCSAGTYSGAGASNCNACPAGSSSASGSSSCTTCPAGSFVSSNVCSTCAAGTYSSASATSCNTCPAGSTSIVGSSSCTTCPAGNFVSSNVCSACAAGTYSSASATSCIPCNSGSTSASGSSSCTACPAGSYASNNMCLTCAEGTYSRSGATSCTETETAISQTLSQAQKATSALSSSVPNASLLLSSAGSGMISAASMLIPLLALLSYIQFLDLSYSPKLRALLEASNPLQIPVPGSFVRAMESSSIQEQDSPSVQYSSFWLNEWEYLLTLGSLGIILLGLRLFCQFKKKSSKSISRKILNRIKAVFIVQFFGGFTDVIFFLVHRAKTLGSGGNSGSHWLLALDFSTAILLQIFLLITVLILWKAKKPILHKFGLEILIEEEEYKGRDFQLLFTLRNSLICLIVQPDLLLLHYPLFQTIVLTFLSFCFLGYLCKRRPFKVAQAEAECLIGEIILLLVNLAILTIAILDYLLKTQKQNLSTVSISHLHNACEGIIIYCNLAVGIYCMTFFCWSGLKYVIQNFQKHRKIKQKLQRVATSVLVLNRTDLDRERGKSDIQQDPLQIPTLERPQPARLGPSQSRERRAHFELFFLYDGHRIRKRNFQVSAS